MTTAAIAVTRSISDSFRVSMTRTGSRYAEAQPNTISDTSQPNSLLIRAIFPTLNFPVFTTAGYDWFTAFIV